MKETLLQLTNASVHYSGVKALENVSIKIDEGEVVVLMGPNGAGKSTVLKALIGLAPLTHGAVLWHGAKVTPVPHEMPARGVAYVPQGRQVFKNLSVHENLQLGGYALPNKKDLTNNIEIALHLFPALREKLGTKAGLLSGGQQQMLTIGRGLVADPRVLFLDEPSLGLAPKVVKEVFEKIREIHEMRNIAIVIVEHSIKSALSVAQRAYVLSHGKVVYEGGAQEVESTGVLEKVFLAADWSVG
jgi:branched-chain amino acid transport system ATP-binding protein